MLNQKEMAIDGLPTEYFELENKRIELELKCLQLQREAKEIGKMQSLITKTLFLCRCRNEEKSYWK